MPPIPKLFSAQQSQLQRLADSAPMILWGSDTAHAITSLNPAALALVDGLDGLDITAWLHMIYPEDAAQARETIGSALADNTEYQVEYRLARSDGSVRWMMGSGAPRFTANGEFAGFTGAILDVTDRHAALARLTESEATYRLIADHSSDLIGHYAAGGVYVYVSPSAREIHGYEPGELLGQNVYDYIHPDDQARIQAELSRQLQTGEESRLVELRLRHKAGHYVWLGSKAQVARDPVTGAHSSTVVISRDITAQREAKAELNAQKERFRSLATLSSDWYWETDEHGVLTFVSDGIRTKTGLEPDDLIGKSRLDMAAGSDQPGVIAFQTRFERREPFRDIVICMLNPARKALQHTRLSGEPMFDGDIFKGYRGVSSDITLERGRTEQLARLAFENHAIVEDSPDMFLILDEQRRIVRFNRSVCAIIGYTPDELIGASYIGFVLPSDREYLHAVMDHSLHTSEAVRDFVSRCTHKNGSLVHISWTVRWAADGRQVYCTGRDVTERLQIHAALQQSNAQLNMVLESIGDGFFAVDRGWRITYANEIAATAFSLNRDTLIGTRLWSALPDISNTPFLSYYQRAMDHGEQASFESYDAARKSWSEVRLYPHADGISVFFHDITRKREAEKAVWLSEQRFREVIEMTPSAYLLADAGSMLVDVNPAMCALSGYSEKELIGRHTSTLFPKNPFPHGDKPGAAARLQSIESELRHKLGHSVFVLINANFRRDDEGKRTSTTAFLVDITARKMAEVQTREMALHDALTGLPNRMYLDEHLPELLCHAAREQVSAVMLIDLDRFKQVNDTMGHAAGDALLREIAARLRLHTRQNDLVARLGGDEFIVIAACSDGVRSAATVARALVDAIAAPVTIDGSQVTVGASIGISMFPADGASREPLFRKADAAMYRVKEGGRNGYGFSEPGYDAVRVDAGTRPAPRSRR
jgi:diguanylate cyclase (GGDEF)-like protein/PAS domain S-box-containing protein